MTKDPVTELARIQRELWQDEAELRELAKADSELAALVAEADAEYERKHGKPWVNPLA